jgi:hypothetical protein
MNAAHKPKRPDPFPIPRLYGVVEAITNGRTKDKEYSKRQPATILRVKTDDEGLTVVIKPKVFWSQSSRWELDSIKYELISEGFVVPHHRTGEPIITMGCRINGAINTDNTVRVGRFFYARFEDALRTLRDALSAFATDPVGGLSIKPDHCLNCGRKLTDELSRSRGIGPECIKSWETVMQFLLRVPADEHNIESLRQRKEQRTEKLQLQLF